MISETYIINNIIVLLRKFNIKSAYYYDYEIVMLNNAFKEAYKNYQNNPFPEP